MAPKITQASARFKTWASNVFEDKRWTNRVRGTVFAAFIYFLTGVLVLFGAVALAKGEEVCFKRAKIELTPSVGMHAGFSPKYAPVEKTAPKNQAAPETLSSVDAANENVVSLAQLDSLREETQVDENADVKARILQLAEEISKAFPETAVTKLSFAGAMSADASIGVSEEDLAILDSQNLGEELEDDLVEEEFEEEDEDDDFAFAYSNPHLGAPSMPASDFSALGLDKLATPDPKPIVQLHPVPYVTPVPAPYRNDAVQPVATVPVAPQVQLQPAPYPSVQTNPSAAVPSNVGAPAQFQRIPYTSVQPIAAANNRPVAKVAAVPVDNFHAKSSNYMNGRPEGKTYRSFDESVFEKNTSRPNSTKNAPVQPSPFRNRFVSNSNDYNPIRQTSAIVRGNLYEDEEYEEDEDLPAVAWRSSYSHDVVDEDEYEEEEEELTPRRSSGFNRDVLLVGQEETEEYDSEELEETVDDESNEVEKTRWTKAEKPTRSEESTAQDQEESSRPIRNAATQSETAQDESKYFLRPFKRMRERRTISQNAPAPPEVDNLNLEHGAGVELAKEPLLTRESSKLPPLAVTPNAAYADEALEGDAPVTKSELEAAREEMKSFSWSKGNMKITPYGFLTLSVSNDTQRSVSGDFFLYAQSAETDSSSGFAVDARTSRIGFKIEGPRIEELNSDLGGCVEFDFQGYPNGSKNKGGVQLRRAFAELVDKQHDRRFLAGQDWEIISPGAPQMLNYLPAGFAGDMQYRRGQLRFEQGYTVSSNAHFLAQIAACDNVLGDYTSTAGVNAASSGWPIIEGRIAADLFKEEFQGRAMTIGLSGHIGEQYYKFSPISGVPICSTSSRYAIKTWSTNVDFELPVLDIHKLHGEYYIGSNLSTFCGGINQGVDLYTRKGIGDQGAWMAFHSDWSKKVATNIGYGFDKPDRDDLVGTSVASNGFTTSRTKNEVYFVNCLYNWTPNFMTGLEVGYWRTDWQKADVSGANPVFYQMKSGKNLRTEFTTRLFF